MKPEEQEQLKIVQYLNILKGQKKILEFFAIVNENNQSFTNRNLAIRIASKAKKMGKKSGVSDMQIILKDKVLFVELKRPMKQLNSGKLSKVGISISDSQIAFLDTVNKSSVCDGMICYGFNEAKEFIDKFI